MAIVYKNVLGQLKLAGYTTYKIRQDKLITEGTLQNIRKGKPITTETINIICSLLNCQVGDIMEYIPEEPDKRGESR